MIRERNTEPQEFLIDLAHAYLEMARALYNASIVREKKPTEEEVLDTFGYDPSGTLSMALASQTLFYSYLALEAMTNELLFQAWQASRQFHEQASRIKNCRLLGARFKPELDWFYKKYGHLDFNQLKGTDLRELKERIKVVCRALTLQPIAEANPELWRRLNQLLVPARQFLTHPIMDHVSLNEIARSILVENPLQYWVDTAVGIIRYLYSNRERDLPAWVEASSLLRFPVVELVTQPDTNKKEENETNSASAAKSY